MRAGFGMKRRRRKCTSTYGNRIINAATQMPGGIQCCASVSLNSRGRRTASVQLEKAEDETC